VRAEEGAADRALPERDRGLTLIEFMVASLVVLIVAGGIYGFLLSSLRAYSEQTRRASTQAAGRAALELVATAARAAGLSPLGPSFPGMPEGDAARVRLRADRDGNGVVGGAAAGDEDVTFRFAQPGGSGEYRMLRSVDLNGDGDCVDAGEHEDVLLTSVVPADMNGDGVAEPFLSYSAPPPAAASVTVTFGLLTAPGRGRDGVIRLQSQVALLNPRPPEPIPPGCAATPPRPRP
jgi:prepilin-type N-terminal cleavage/methylation domain-containing protein